MKVRLINRGTKGELLLEGRLDAVTSQEVEKIFNDMAQRFDCVVLNMADLTYISSAGLRVIKLLHMKMRKKNGELLLINVNKMVMEVFEMTGFVGLLKIQ
ncbi:MAG: STAS domain-containing protein [Clostridiales bacterium]|nr:STAS domain-containing protein [Candidatus Cacconaster stercorequi]